MLMIPTHSVKIDKSLLTSAFDSKFHLFLVDGTKTLIESVTK